LLLAALPSVQPDAVYPIVEISDKETTDEWRTRCWQEIRSYAWAVAVEQGPAAAAQRVPTTSWTRSSLRDKGANGPSTLGQPMVYQEARANGLAVLTWAFCEDNPQAMAGDFSMVSLRSVRHSGRAKGLNRSEGIF